MRIMKTVVMLTLILLGNMGKAQQKAKEQEQTYTIYTFSYAQKYKGNEPILIISNVQHFESKWGYVTTSLQRGINNQWHDYLKAEYKDYYDFSTFSQAYMSQKEAETYRRKIMGNWNDKIIKISDFAYFED